MKYPPKSQINQPHSPRPRQIDSVGDPINPEMTSFAREMAAAAFGRRHDSLREWSGFVDLTPAEVAARRAK